MHCIPNYLSSLYIFNNMSTNGWIRSPRWKTNCLRYYCRQALILITKMFFKGTHVYKYQRNVQNDPSVNRALWLRELSQSSQWQIKKSDRKKINLFKHEVFNWIFIDCIWCISNDLSIASRKWRNGTLSTWLLSS